MCDVDRNLHLIIYTLDIMDLVHYILIRKAKNGVQCEIIDSLQFFHLIAINIDVWKLDRLSFFNGLAHL